MRVTSKSKNPKRVAAGRHNRQKRKPLSSEAIDRLRNAINERKPWTRSTGPRTEEGKRKVAGNARKLSSKEPQSPDWLQFARQVQKSIAKLSRGCHLDPNDLQLVESRSVAEDLRKVIPWANKQFAKELAARLLSGSDD